ncbi:MAG: prepilin-type N-terminal cleavage/methylation domain-containing protein [Deltaproteobacteria bacterium]|nr:prepilin-type N-terminal cleavage/methylation domain-containing protein [Deltaproteobacteria bacterium]
MRSEAGLTLIEVLVAVVITFVIFLGITNAGLVVLDQNIKNLQRDQAVSVADNVMQQARNIPYDNLVLTTTTDNVFVQVRGSDRTYAVTRNIAAIDNVNAALGRQVTVTVSWTRTEYGQPRTYNHTIMTIVRPR